MAAFATAQKGFNYAVELRQLLGSLRQAQIRCIPLKGPVLTMGSYRRMGLRDFDDLDLLVTPADVPGAVAVLATLGFSGWDIPEPRLASHLSTESEHNLICPQAQDDRGPALGHRPQVFHHADGF